MAVFTPGAEVLRGRVLRASEVRESIGALWDEYVERDPRRIGLVADDGSNTRWTLVIHTNEPMPVRISTLFGEWLYLLRAALDGVAYYAAVRDSGQNPPPNERNIHFPIKTAPGKYDSQSHREALKALSISTFAGLRTVQPFNAPPARARGRLRRDRRDQPHALARSGGAGSFR
ncbi:hypothetical protein [Mycobacterium sp. 1274756.6]|uniref:hypothetical protein n=1 Tax=Mycobacterium sp. 1274756.6 TaxID=1834076 RepID=UPI0012E84213|nr:hypothetical protein [Mycobacterium sp. 1274756.6]